MPLPNPDVLDAFIDLYLNYRDKAHEATDYVTWFFQKANDLSKKAFGQLTDKKSIRFCRDVKNEFRPKDREMSKNPNAELSYDDWVEVVFRLGKKAQEAQNEKIGFFWKIGISDRESALCETLHALRNYIVIKLKEADKNAFDRIIKEKYSKYLELSKKSDC